MAPPVTAIVVNWNGEDHLGGCLGSLAEQDYTDLDVLVVDNGSSDRSAAIVAATSAGWIPLGSNTGLAPAFNHGAALAGGELMLFLNNDMRFPPEFVSEMVACHERNLGCGAVDAVQLDWEGNTVVHGATRMRRGGLRGDLPGWNFELVEPSHDARTLFPSGAHTLISRKTFLSIGGWDPRFIAGSEDVDLGWRLWLAGLPVLVAAEAVCFHKVGASSRSADGARIRAEASLHGHLLFALKHAPVEVIALAFGRALLGLLRVAVQLRALDVRMRFGVARRLVSEAQSTLRWRRLNYRGGGITPRRFWHALRAI